MIMRPGQQLLLPANPVFIAFSLVLALFFNMAVNMAWGRVPWVPDLLAVLLVFWSVHQPLRVGIGTAFFFGLCMDVHQTGLLGQHALSYTVLSFLAIAMHRRLLWFTVPSQAMQVLPLFVAAHVIDLVLRMLGGGIFPGWWMLLAPLLESVLWPLVSVVLLAPQRMAPNPDKTRPL
ncbi:MAG: rod shape-determining protein MreD [Burkholderiales bacterium]|jgi:rod shape-determining protein MreD|nr:rod shape-determining protein MreD [Burkholderiales bacterium]